MSRIKKLIKRMRLNKIGIRCNELVKLLHCMGYVEVPGSGSSHNKFKPENPLLPVVCVWKYHGGRDCCHEDDVDKVLKVLNYWEKLG